MNKLFGIIAALFILLALTACQKKEAAPEEGNVQIGNPWVDCETLSEAAKTAGFDMTIPGKIDGYPNRVYQAIKNAMIQVLYFDGDPEDEESSRVMVRKETGSEDISGDYNTYPENETVNLHGVDVRMRGENGLIYSASWTWEGYSFAISADKGLSREALADAVEEMVTVIG